MSLKGYETVSVSQHPLLIKKKSSCCCFYLSTGWFFFFAWLSPSISYIYQRNKLNHNQTIRNLQIWRIKITKHTPNQQEKKTKEKNWLKKNKLSFQSNTKSAGSNYILNTLCSDLALWRSCNVGKGKKERKEEENQQ